MPSEIFRPGLLEGQVAIVTGGGSGIGRATALELASCGATVVVAGRRAEPLEETASLASGGACEPVVADIREEEDVEALVGGVLERHGRVDLLVNNAGGQYMSPAEDITPKGFRTVVRLNLEGTWLMTHAVATKAMIPSGSGGKIVNVTLSPHHGLPGMVHSSAARAAVENMTRVLSIEWARFGIRVTAIATGHFQTEEQAWLVAFLASPAGDYYSGAIITLDGARDNWLGPWPPVGLTDEEGNPLAEERRA